MDGWKHVDGSAHAKYGSAMGPGERRKAASPIICKHLSETVGDFLVSDNAAAIYVSCVVKHSEPYSVVAPVVNKVAEEAAKPFCPGEDENIVEKTATHQMLKSLIQHDKVRMKEDPNAEAFSNVLLKNLDEDGLESWITCNRGTFLFVVMLETELEDVVQNASKKLEAISKTLKRQQSKGAKVLRDKIALK